MAIKINNVTVVTDNEELDCSNSSIVFWTATTATLPSSNNVDGDTVFNTDTNELMVFWNGEWVRGSGGFKATGGNRVEQYGGRTYHIFTSPGNFEVRKGEYTTYINYCIVGGGGGGGRQGGGGGGAGQLYVSSFPDQYFSSTNNNTCVVTVGAGGAGGGGNPALGQPGGITSLNFNPAVAAEVSCLGGGGGGSLDTSVSSSQVATPGQPGASGGGGGAAWRQGQPGGNATPYGGRAAGQPGGSGTYGYDSYFSGGGGGSHTQRGANASGTYGGAGGYGQGVGGLIPSVGTPGPNVSFRYFAGGGAGTGWNGPTGRPAYGGGGSSTGSGNVFPAPTMQAQLPGTNALPNTGSGGGGRSWNSPGSGYSNGAAGIAILHYVTPT